MSSSTYSWLKSAKPIPLISCDALKGNKDFGKDMTKRWNNSEHVFMYHNMNIVEKVNNQTQGDWTGSKLQITSPKKNKCKTKGHLRLTISISECKQPFDANKPIKHSRDNHKSITKQQELRSKF